MALFHMYSSGVRPLPGVQQRTTHLAFALMLIFLMFPFRSKSDESQEEKVADEFRPLGVADIVLASPFLLSRRLCFLWSGRP